jgi:hypothetical protein
VNSLMTIYKIPIQVTWESNKTEHWSKKAKRHKMQKIIVRTYLLNKPIVSEPPWIVTLSRFSPRPMDEDNLQMAFKWIRDTIADFLCGCTVSKSGKVLHGRSDSDERITWQYRQEKAGIKEYYIMIQIDSHPG